jgi:hypothetical protein
LAKGQQLQKQEQKRIAQQHQTSLFDALNQVDDNS